MKLLKYSLVIIGILGFISSCGKNCNLPVHGQQWTVPEVNIPMIYVHHGGFIMGNNKEENLYTNEHKVVITSGYWIGRHEITRREYYALMPENAEKEKVKEKTKLFAELLGKMQWNIAGN